LIAPGGALRVAVELDLRDWSILLFAALVSTVAAAVGWTIAIRRLGPESAGPLLSLVPVVGVTNGALALGEQLTGRIVVGAAITIAGVVLAMHRPAADEPGDRGSFRNLDQAGPRQGRWS
jgi:O-acetylserine/cysteine efflux transporter